MTERSRTVEDDTPHKRVKRRRTAIACNTCRTRKSRCNGARPICSLCSGMGFQCIYEEPASSINTAGNESTLNTLSRIELLERLVMALQQQLSAVKALSNRESSCAASPQSGDPEPGVVLIEVQPQGSDNPEDSNEPDGMAISFVDERDHGYFGPSSNVAFMRTIFQSLVRRGLIRDSLKFPSAAGNSYGTTSQAQTRRRGMPSNSPQASSVPSLDQSYLPPYHETSNMIRQYFATVGVLYPYIHEPSFLQTYEQMKQPGFPGKVNRTWLALLNVMLAMSMGEGDSSQAAEKSLEFYNRAQGLCGNRIYRGNTLETVQYLLLSTQYLQGMQKAVQTWITHGLAVKIAVAIGLHSQEMTTSRPIIEQEMRKRTWHGCVLLDRTLSMTYGRPSAIPEECQAMSLPKSLMTMTDVDSIRSVAFFTATIKLYDILGRILRKLYGNNVGGDCRSLVDQITWMLQLQSELNQWRTALPAELSLVNGVELSEITARPLSVRLERYRLILTVRYMSIQLLLRRPLLVSLLQNTTADKAVPQATRDWDYVQSNLLQGCTQSAEEIIVFNHHVLTNENLGRGYLSVWWFTIYYIFNAGLVVFASVAQYSDNTESDRDKRRRTQYMLGLAVDALACLGEDNVLIRRCVTYLQRLMHIVAEWSAKHHGQGTRGVAGVASSDQIDKVAATVATEALQMRHATGVFMTEPLNCNQTFESFDEEFDFGPLVNNEFERWFEDTSWALEQPVVAELHTEQASI